MSKESNRKYRNKMMWKKRIEKGHCPVCSMLLVSKFHINCPYFEIIERENRNPYT